VGLTPKSVKGKGDWTAGSEEGGPGVRDYAEQSQRRKSDNSDATAEATERVEAFRDFRSRERKEIESRRRRGGTSSRCPYAKPRDEGGE